MTVQSIHQLIGNAVVDREFGQALLEGHEEVLRRYGIGEDERRLICSLRASSVQELAARLLEQLGARSDSSDGR